MTADPSFGMAMYNQLPYRYPLFEAQGVVRIPVIGPEPFNTLVVVRLHAAIGELAWADGKLHSPSVGPVSTGFILAGDDDPRRPRPPSDHSTMAMLNHQQLKSGDALAGDSPFVNAFDDVVDGRFEYIGGKWQWCLWWTTSWLADQAWSAVTVYVSSWVLCWEPPLDPEHRPPPDISAQIWRPFDPTAPTTGPDVRGLSGPGGRPRTSRTRTSRHTDSD